MNQSKTKKKSNTILFVVYECLLVMIASSVFIFLKYYIVGMCKSMSKWTFNSNLVTLKSKEYLTL